MHRWTWVSEELGVSCVFLLYYFYYTEFQVKYTDFNKTKTGDFVCHLHQMETQQRQTEEFVSGLLEKLHNHQQLVSTFTEQQSEGLKRHIDRVQDVSTSQNQLSQVCVILLAQHLAETTWSGKGLSC